MPVNSSSTAILIVEPNVGLQRPYIFLDAKSFVATRVNDVFSASLELQKQSFNLIFLSCSFSNKKILNFLETVKQASKSQIIPLLLVVDLSQPYSIVPGLTWDQKIALLSSQTSKTELEAIVHRLL